MNAKGVDPNMGRGRARAKQTRVARDLKYRTFDTDFSSLERELRGQQPVSEDPNMTEEFEEYDDPYAVDDGDDEADEGPAYGYGR